MTTIIGHRALLQTFSRLIRNGTFPQVSLFHGLNGSGKKTVALQLARTFLCEVRQEQGEILQPCGACRACLLFEGGNHPDFSLITPTAPKSADSGDAVRAIGSIKTEQIVELKKKIQYPPLMAERQVVIIDNAELMTAVTTNSLLKLLEEPRSEQIFILVTSRLSRILVTIRSRAAKFYFPALKPEEVLAILRPRLEAADLKIDAQTLAFYTECFPGSPSLVLEGLRSPLDPAKLARILDKERDFIEVNEMAKDVIASGMPLPIFLHVLRAYVLGRIRARNTATPPELGLIDRIGEAERRLERHIPEEFVLENLFL